MASETKSHDLRVTSRVVVPLFLITSLGHNHPGSIHNERSDRDITRVESLPGEVNRKPHEFVIGRHAPHFIQLRDQCPSR